MTLNEFKTMLKGSINRGDTYDSVLDSYIEQALRWIESNETYKYMERYVTFTLDASAANPRVIALPSLFKSFGDQGFVRYTYEGEFVYLPQVSPKDVTANENGVPTAFWIDGLEYVWFDNTVQEDLDCEMSYIAYSSLPAEDATNFPLTYMTEALQGKCLELLGVPMRNEGVIKAGRSQLDRALSVMEKANFEINNSNTNSAMVYK